MPFVNALEPEALLQTFMAYPPEGFRPLTSTHDLPAFETRFDLTTTVEPELRRRVQGLPGHRLWGELLRPWTTFVGSTVSEYAWLPAHWEPAALAQALTRRYADARPFLIVKDLPVGSPLLEDSHNAWSAAFTEALLARGFVLVEGQALAWVPIDFESEDVFLARLSRGARRDIRRKLRSRADLDIEAIPTGSPRFDDDEELGRFFALYEEVYAQSEIHFDRLGEAFFRALLRDPQSGGLMFVYRHQGRLIGWNLCYEHGANLVDKYIGFSYPAAREHNLYAVSWMHNLDHARRRGLRHFVAGWTDPEVKAHLGARFTFTRHAVRPRSRLLRLALRRLSAHFESDRQWYDTHVQNTRRS